MHGYITKVVATFGSTWGRIQPDGKSREIFFFNADSLDPGVDFSSLVVGQAVSFSEQRDQVNGSHAEHLTLSTPVAADARGF